VLGGRPAAPSTISPGDLSPPWRSTATGSVTSASAVGRCPPAQVSRPLLLGALVPAAARTDQWGVFAAWQCGTLRAGRSTQLAAWRLRPWLWTSSSSDCHRGSPTIGTGAPTAEGQLRSTSRLATAGRRSNAVAFGFVRSAAVGTQPDSRPAQGAIGSSSTWSRTSGPRSIVSSVIGYSSSRRSGCHRSARSRGCATRRYRDRQRRQIPSRGTHRPDAINAAARGASRLSTRLRH